ncbi:uncharacterized protein PV06_09088 [Exophiala oligosperma]|uniref:Nucleolar pre-ribosomal-associated protein 1 N-terminal domain-containing protein n=1 Tax=Exophiala oligosperma TaxID=215243 RepID=A0A0D2DUP6_9EURO|nr:uncharacterized protein PV06_09088 [Exophiala oligosperma]KIW39304.1 hypothetical protein PV06_09088 [Exophiala oligosperma]
MASLDGGARKRRKLDDSVPPADTLITSSSQLKNLFNVPSESSNEIKKAVEKFTHFLSSVSRDAKSNDGERQLKILKTYCDDQSSSSHDKVDFPDLLSAWSNASQSNDDAVFATVPAALTQFFQAISGNVDFREFGLSLCYSLLKRDQLRLFDKGLSSPRNKDLVISHCLQLLTEVISFDAGALATNVFGRRDLLYRCLDGILNQPKLGDHRLKAHASALEFLLANLRYLDATSKGELITQGKTLHAAFRSLPVQSSDIIIETINALEKSILGDANLSKQLKIRCFNSGNLSALAKLYDFDTFDSEDNTDRSPAVREALQHLLLQVCATPKGVLLPQTGWYPAGLNPDAPRPDSDMIDLGLDSPYYSDDYADKVPVKNNSLATFIQTLHPEKDVLQAQLVTSIFAAGPELVADYFTKKRKVLASPADDPLWRGQFAFLFSIVQLPVPENCGWHDKSPASPPPLSVVIESILPRPLDRATVTKCLHSDEDVLVLSAARLLTVSLEKLDSVLTVFEQGHPGSHLWTQASSKLINLFIERIPQLQDTITGLQRLTKGKEQIRTVVLECIATYHRVMPSLTAGAKFDIGPIFIQNLQRLDPGSLDADNKETLEEQLPHLSQIAEKSPATKWFHKPNAETLSLMAQVLRYCVSKPDSPFTKNAAPIIQPLLRIKGVLSNNVQSLGALFASLASTKKWEPEPATYQFLDNCMTRTMQRPVKYLDQVEQEQKMASDSKELSLIACCMSEQWPFVVKKGDKKGTKNVAEWIARFFGALDAAGENYRVMTTLKQAMLESAQQNAKAREYLEKAFEKQRKTAPALPELGSEDGAQVFGSPVENQVDAAHSPTTRQEELVRTVDLDETCPPLPRIPTSLSGLDRWTKPDFETEIHSGRLADLLRCLVHPEAEIRVQAFHTVQTVMHAVEQSAYPEKTQLYLLLGEVSETTRVASAASGGGGGGGGFVGPPPPSVVAELAVHLLPVVADPTSPYYRKANRFLLLGPHWTVSRLLPHWLSATFLSEPEADDTDVGNQNAQALEVDHLLGLLAASLRTEVDLDLFRRGHVFTRLMSHFLSSNTPRNTRTKILHVLHRAAGVPGGSDTLITRTGVREWLVVAAEVTDRHAGGTTVGGGGGGGRQYESAAEKVEMDNRTRRLVDALAAEIDQTCTKSVIERWEADRPLTRLERERVET